jgi:hypothetical protein
MKKTKDYIKKNPEPAKGRFGINPFDPWSAKYNVSEDLTTNNKGAGDSRSKISHSPTQQRASELDKAAKFYQIKTPTGSMGSKSHHEEKHMNKKEPNQNTALTPESVEIKKEIEGKVRGELKHIRNKESKMYNKQLTNFIKKVKEIHSEETVNEVSAKKLLGYMMKAGSKKDPKKDTKDRSSNVMKATGKYLKTQEETVQSDPWKQKHFGPTKPTGKRASPEEMAKMKADDKRFSDAMASDMKRIDQDPKLNAMLGRKKVKEETYMDAKAATPSVMSPGEGISEKMTTAQRVMMLKKKLKEDMHDHEKEDKSVATYGKKPKFEKAEKDEGGENKPTAAATMTGGTTLTGSKRDDVEIDPMMRNRPGQPDVTKGKDKKDDKDKDKKKDK